jgi:hypothetical protein
MELNILKMLGALLSNMTMTEAVSLLSMLGGSVWVAIKGLLRFQEYLQKVKGSSTPTTGNNNTNTVNDTAHQQILIQLQMAKDKLLAVEAKIDDQNFTMPKELATELGHMMKKLEEIHQEHVTAHKEIGKTVVDNLDNIAVMKEKITNIESNIPRLKSDLKEAIKEIQTKVDTTSERVGIMQGLLTANGGTRQGR